MTYLNFTRHQVGIIQHRRPLSSDGFDAWQNYQIKYALLAGMLLTANGGIDCYQATDLGLGYLQDEHSID
jgi:hypothetical protein